MKEKRQHARLEFSARVKLMHPVPGALVADTRDLSHGGVFLFTGDKVNLPIGTEVTIQDQDMGTEAPLVRAVIVRVESAGIALKFCAGE